MEIRLIVIGKTFQDFVKSGIEEYSRRINKFVKFKLVELPDIKNSKSLPQDVLKEKEAILLKKYLDDGYNILLDENGKQFSSVEFAHWLEGLMNRGVRRLNFCVGGSFGFSQELLKKYDSLSLSKMTFSHQLVRLIFVEQLYRAFTIIKSLPYHH